MSTSDFDKAKRLIEQLDPVLRATETLRKAHNAGLKEPSGHPNMHPVRAAIKDLEAELEKALGEIARSRRQDDIERQRRQAQYKKK